MVGEVHHLASRHYCHCSHLAHRTEGFDSRGLMNQSTESLFLFQRLIPVELAEVQSLPFEVWRKC